MKKILTSICLLIGLGAFASAADWQADYARLLKKYVTPGGVRYAEWKANADDVKAIQSVVDAIAAAPASTAKSKEALAFHLNAYNAWILHEAVAKYPVKSVKDALFTFFTGKRIKVAGEEMSFNHLEKEIIRPRFAEPRVHFALNCASRSCPPLLSEPFDAAQLDKQLDERARSFINSPKGVRVTGETWQVSKVFDWYADDFGGKQKTIEFINRHRAKPGALPKSVSYDDYDWGLNEAK